VQIVYSAPHAITLNDRKVATIGGNARLSQGQDGSRTVTDGARLGCRRAPGCGRLAVAGSARLLDAWRAVMSGIHRPGVGCLPLVGGALAMTSQVARRGAR
jgi:hypothetical protein